MTTLNETPRKSRSTSERIRSEGLALDRRTALLEEVPNVPEIEFDNLVDAVLAKDWNDPNLPSTVSSAHIAQTLEILERNGTIARGRWRGFELDPCKQSRDEVATFKQLQPLFRSIVDASPFADSNLLNLIVDGCNSPASDTRFDGTRPDSYMLLRKCSIPDEERAVHRKSLESFLANFVDIPAVCEFKMQDSPTNLTDDISKVLWGMHHCMRNDARRRFVYGITIENTALRFWYNDRSVVLVSKPIEWTTDHRSFVKLMLGFAACSHLQQLGYDSTTRRLITPRNNSNYHAPVYELDVRTDRMGEKETFVTRRIIANFGADPICGRGTRVWIVVRKEDYHSGVDMCPEYILKDCWIDSDREPEGGVLELLHLIRLCPPGDQFNTELDALRKHIPTTVCHGMVQFPYESRPPSDPSASIVPSSRYHADRTLRLHRGGTVLSYLTRLNTLFPNRSTQPTAVYSNSLGDDILTSAFSIGGVPLLNPPPPPAPAPNVIQRDLRHYRIVLSPVAESFTRLNTLKKVFTAVLGAARALKYLYYCGYVHRDVSTGNIIYHEDRGLLIDLEYSKRIDAETPAHESATGTRQFMSIEVAQQNFLFSPKVLDLDQAVLPSWKHNILHDLDSIWWISVWAAFTFKRPQTVPSPMDSSRFGQLFPTNQTVSERDPVSRAIGVGHLVAASYNQSIWIHLAKWRLDLAQFFESSQFDYYDGGNAQPTAKICLEAFDSSFLHLQNILNLGEVLDTLVTCQTL